MRKGNEGRGEGIEKRRKEGRNYVRSIGEEDRGKTREVERG